MLLVVAMKFIQGFSLIELMVVLALLVLTLSFGLPSFSYSSDLHSLGGTAELIRSQLVFAQSEAVKGNKKVYLHFCRHEGRLVVGLAERDQCDCAQANSCVLNGGEKVTPILDGQRFHLVNLTFNGDQASFSPTRFGANAGSLYVGNNQAQVLRVKVSKLGRIVICSHQGKVPGYKVCL